MFKRKSLLNHVFAGVLVLAPMAGGAQEVPEPIHKVTVALGRTIAVKYNYLGGSTRIGFHGTVLLPLAEGKAKVKIHDGGAAIHAVFEHLEPAARFGPEYMTYVLWSIAPGGQVANLGEVRVKPNGKTTLDATTSLGTFGLVVTAEPHFAVTSPSDLLVLENVLTGADRSKVEEVNTQFPLLPRASYVLRADPADLQAPALDKRVSPYVYQARNAMRLALAEQADLFAQDLYRKAETSQAKLDADKKQWKKPAILLARQVVQLAEDARLVAIRNREELQRSQAQKAAEEAQERAEAKRIQAEAERAEAEVARDRAAREALQGHEEAAREASQATRKQVRRQLSTQLRQLLQTQESEHGLVVRMPHPLFATGRAELLAPAREKLAKVAGILLAYPGLKIQVEGHTDSTGSPAFNQDLSERRAENVRTYLHLQGIPPHTTSSVGLGASKPLTSNETPGGRQKNRRVELVVSGEPIGI